ncbi:MAG: MBL fold metallo-hydrolase [Spirochaetales bacterium]|nr:MBL fold metallo-hydrolase [Spirochaetales bacterium]
MIRIKDNVFQVEKLKSGQVYVLVDNGSVILIDSGFIGDMAVIERQLDEMNIKMKRISTIILTHCHIDHTANLNAIKRASNARIIAHKDERQYLENKKKMEYSRLYKKLLWSFLHLLMKTETIVIDREVAGGDIIDVYGGLEVIHTPGHTPGSIALYQKKEKILFSGDCLLNEKGLRIARGIYNQDDHELYESVKKLKAFDIQIICPGHGKAITEDGNQRINDAVLSY